MRIKQKFGFSLVELMIVLSIIAIIASFAIPKFKELRANAFDMTAKTIQRSLITQVNAFKDDILEDPSITNPIWTLRGNGDQPNQNPGSEIWSRLYLVPPEQIVITISVRDCNSGGFSSCGFVNVGHCKSTPEDNPELKYHTAIVDNKFEVVPNGVIGRTKGCLLYTSPSPRDRG